VVTAARYRLVCPERRRGKEGWGKVPMRSYSVLFRASIAATLLAALALSGCGRKGPLEPPPAATATTQTQDQNAPDEPEKPDRRIVLDNLL
jgi:predicted small lipoprotein YifL